MRKKILKRGYCTSMISLPRAWIRRNNLDFGDEVLLRTANNGLIITAENDNGTCKVNVGRLRPWTNHYFCQFYQQGCSKIEFTNINKKEKAFIRERLWNFPGSKVIESKTKKLVIGIEDYNSDYSVFLNRMFDITFENFGMITNKNNKIKQNLKEIYRLDELITRKINQSVPEIDFYYIHEIPMTLFLVNKSLYECYEYINTKQISISKKTANLLKLNKTYLNFVYRHRFKGQKINFKKHLALRKKLYYEPSKNHNYFAECDVREFYVLEKVLFISRLVSILNSKYAMFLALKEFNEPVKKTQKPYDRRRP